MKAIRQYKLEIEPTQFLDIPFNSEFLWFGLVEGAPTIVMLADSNYGAIKRKFHIFPADKELEPRYNKSCYIGTFEYPDKVGKKVLFVFEEF